MQASNLLSRFWLTDRFGHLCQSKPLNPDEVVYSRDNSPSNYVKGTKTPLLPCFANKSISYAQRLGHVGFDHLAFTIRLNKFEKLPCDAWVKLPVYKTYPDTVEGLDLFQEHVLLVRHLRLEQFVNRVLGLKLGSTRNYGRFFYTQSRELMDKKGKVSVGFIAFGGNDDTVYFQISGTGCKHVFTHTNGHRLHHWLSFFDVKVLRRLDLFYDDFDGNFDCKYAELAYRDGAFKRAKGGKNPKISETYDRDDTGLLGEIVRIGSRTSLVYWRIYNKALEQGVKQTWYRTEVELKDVSIDVLLAPAKHFAGLCPFSESINLSEKHALSPVFKQKKSVTLTLEAKTQWLRRQCGRAIYDLVEDWKLSAEETLIALVGNNPKHGGKLSAPEYYSEIIRF
ncbi:replication initiation factor domain-containing protein [Shewanella baltica]|uniref:replication initiation factor domain-containing protein n=1 Tax=Shewanella TaxID=22 RepID=UPI0021DB6993|nr:replication initiation factor domain-containing protein [Shewanella sp. SM29]MCU8076900.1 replication initiation factor domain-containing protein [Shewanella sp. SM29]